MLYDLKNNHYKYLEFEDLKNLFDEKIFDNLKKNSISGNFKNFKGNKIKINDEIYEEIEETVNTITYVTPLDNDFITTINLPSFFKKYENKNEKNVIIKDILYLLYKPIMSSKDFNLRNNFIHLYNKNNKKNLKMCEKTEYNNFVKNFLDKNRRYNLGYISDIFSSKEKKLVRINTEEWKTLFKKK